MKHVNEPLGGSAPRKDPFGDLVRAVEGGGAKPVSPSAPVYGGFEPIEVPPQSNWDSFTYERESPPRRAVSNATLAPVATPALSGEMRVDPADADWQIDEALRGLSSPARPRVNAPAETQSFAPARLADDHPVQAGRTLDDFDELIASELAAMRTAPPVEDEGYYDDYEDDETYQPQRRTSRGRSAVMLVGGLAAAVVVGAVGVVAWSGASSVGGSGDSPLLIKADAEPFKIAPADPGGRSIPNQNKAVYERVAGAPDAAPTQHELVTAIEEPLEIAEDEPAADELPGVDVEDVALPGAAPAGTPVSTATAESETLQPRKVRTLTVRPDGTLVATDVPADAAGASAMLPASSTAHAAVLDPVAGITPSMPFGDDAAMTTASTSASTPAADEPAAAPAAPEPVQQASVSDAPRVGEGFYVQISSQPSEAAARESMENMTRRFSSQIGSRGVGIRTAEIPGKGTFYRVRVAAETRDEAVSLCETLKSAGGSCFVTR